MSSQVRVHPDALELADLLRSSWPAISNGLRASGTPLNEGDPDPAPDPKPDPEPDPQPRTVPLSELQRERKAKQALEQRLAQLEADAETRRQAELSETERLKEQIAAEKARGDDLERKVGDAGRRQLVIDAAVAAGFEKPGAAVKLIDGLESIESAEDAEAAVKKVAGEYPGLLNKPQTPGPDLKEVLQNGQRPEPGKGGEKLLTKSELATLTPDRQAELQDKHPGLIERSLAATAT